jgi:CheY-like chemotaxis protein
VNLVVNASDAMPEGGELTIETSSVRLDREYCTSHLGVNPGEYVMVSVSDTGVGMTEEVKAHLFEPFFTTKPHGTGLGLSTCYGIVKQAGGHIGVYSEVGRGTTMKVYLPRERVGEQARPNPKDYPERTASAESVLVVDDEAPVRQLMASWLLEEGYHVLEAGSGNQALQIGRGHSGPILVIICDLVLPGIEGRELVGQLKALHPEAGVVFASGYPEHAAVQRGMLESSTLFLQKPFTHAQLTSAIRQVIARQAGQAQQAAGAKART